LSAQKANGNGKILSQSRVKKNTKVLRMAFKKHISSWGKRVITYAEVAIDMLVDENGIYYLA